MPMGTITTVRLLPHSRGSQNLFCAFLAKREVMPMYMTWELFFQFCAIIVAIIGLVISIHNNKKR